MGERVIYTNVPDKKPKTPKEPKKRRKRKKRHIILRMIGFIFRLIGTVLLIGLTTGAILACFGAVYLKTVIMPQATMSLEDLSLQENSVMFYTDDYGQSHELVTLQNVASSVWKDYHEIPNEMIIATVAIEDKRFWEHPGVDWRRTGSAVVSMFTGGDVEGGSTLTQQLIKNATQYDEVTVKRKIVEIFTAFEVDSTYSKEEIITYYLNMIYLGEGNYGVGAAALYYFGKDLSELSLAECASLISITNNPSLYSPFNTFIMENFKETGKDMNGRERNKYRQELVLDQLLEQGLVSQSQYITAKNEVLNFVRAVDEEEPESVYSWYEEQVIDDVRDDLMKTYGYSAEVANRMLASGGLSIYTLLDPEAQATAEAVYEDWSNLPAVSANGQKLQSAITVIDNRTGDVVAMVGQMGEKSQNLLKNFATETYRQPGSSIKPLSVYAPALDMGLLTPVSSIDDYPYSLEGGKAWPSNSYGSYRGMISLEYALRHSSNCAAVRVMGDLLTPEVSFEYMTEVLHFDLVDAMESFGSIMTDRAIAPLALGGLTVGVNTRDMAEAYASFPNEGVYTQSRTYSKVLNSRGEVILDNTSVQEVAMKETTAYYINELLMEVLTSDGTGTDAQISGLTLAGKTGTTNDNYDKWFVGYSSYYTAAVWTGYEYNEEIKFTGNPAITMWKKVMEPLHEGLENRSFSVPEGMKAVSYCLDSGLLAGSYCGSDPRGSRVASKMIYSGDAPTETCTVHTSRSSVTVCLSSATVDEEGNSSGYRLANSYCTNTRTSTYLNLSRVTIGSARASDSGYVYGSQGSLGTCTIHGAGSPSVDDLVDEWLDPENPFGDTFPSTGDSGDTSTGNTGNTGSNSGTMVTPDSSEIPGLPSTTPTEPSTPSTPSEPTPEPSEPTPSEPSTPEVSTPDPVPESSMIPGVG